MRQRWARRLLVAYLLVLAGLTLAPFLGPRVTDALVGVVEALGAAHAARTIELVDGVTNVVLFVPAGLLLGVAAPRLPRVAVWLICLTASVGIEAAQALAVPGRDASLVDIATNTLGAAVGVLLAATVQPRVRAR